MITSLQVSPHMPACRLLKEALEQLTGTNAQARQAFALIGGQVMEGDDEGLDDSDSGSVVEEAKSRRESIRFTLYRFSTGTGRFSKK